MRAVLLAIATIICLNGFSQTKKDYIYTYADVAVREMERAKIPASITLAQGILESRFGTSELSANSNNHFGIKCHKGWNGGSVKYTDDAPDECFRAYSSPDESFSDHSAFLSKRGRYSDLFKLSIYDYKGWAKGLRKAGYATNPKYADHLIRIIEEEKLYVFDRMSSREVGPYVASLRHSISPNQLVVLDHKQNTRPVQPDVVVAPEVITVQGGPAAAPEDVVAQSRDIFIENKSKAVYTFSGDSPSDLARLYGVPLKKLYKYNEWPQYLNEFTWGMKVYLQPKKSKSKEVTHRYHTVKPGETMYQIAQRYGIVTEKLYERNRMSLDLEEQPRAGEVISLRKKVQLKPLLSRAEDSFSVDEMEQQAQDEAVEITSEEPATQPPVIQEVAAPVQKPEPVVIQSTPAPTTPTTQTSSSTPTTSDEDIWGSYPSTQPVEVEEPKSVQPVEQSEPTAPEQTTGRSIIYDPTPAVNQQPVRVYTPTGSTRQPQPTANPTPTVVPTVTPTTTPRSSPTPSSQATYHTVVSGDTLWGLSQKYNVSVDNIKSWNDLANNNIKVGQRLIVNQ